MYGQGKSSMALAFFLNPPFAHSYPQRRNAEIIYIIKQLLGLQNNNEKNFLLNYFAGLFFIAERIGRITFYRKYFTQDEAKIRNAESKSRWT